MAHRRSSVVHDLTEVKSERERRGQRSGDPRRGLQVPTDLEEVGPCQQRRSIDGTTA